RGVGSFYITPTSLAGNSTHGEQFPYQLGYDQQTTFEMGGPVKKDRLWLYGMFPWARFLDFNPGVDPSLPGSPGKGYKPFLKGTLRASDHDNVEVMVHSDTWRFPANGFRTNPIDTQTVEHMKTPKVIGHWTHVLGSGTALQIKGGGIYIRDNITPFTDDFQTSGRTDLATGISTRNATSATHFLQNRTTIDASVAHTASDFIKGSHDFKFGVQTGYATTQNNTLTFGNASF